MPISAEGRDLLAEARGLTPKLRAWRRHLHRHPELSFDETETQRFLLRELRALGTDPRAIAGTGVAVDVGPARADSAVAIRADMDALPIHEVDGRPYGSARPGVMHACGHDVHTACALGAVALLLRTQAALPRRVRVLFQPGEELLPGGATKVIADGGLADPPVTAIAALHVAPDLPAGEFGTRSGPYMASADEVYLAIHGRGGHAALPHRADDVVLCAAEIVTSLQRVVSRLAPAAVPTVLSFGKVETEGGATNVLPATVRLAGTFRTYDDAWREEAHAHVRRIVAAVAEAHACRAELEIRRGYPALSNDPELTRVTRAALAGIVGDAAVRGLDLRPTAEDFAWYLREVPGCFFRLGVRNEARGITAGVHTPEFDVDEACLPYGAAALAAVALTLAEQRPGRD